VKHLQDLKAGGVYDVGHQAVDHIIRAVESGSDLFTLFGITKPNYSLIVGSDIKSYSDLRGKQIGVDGVSTGFALLLKHMLLKNGLVDGEDYELVQIGGTGERYQAVLDGKVAGALLDGPADLIAEANGLNRLGSNLDYIPQYQGTVAATKKSYAEENRVKLISYIRAYIAASDWLYDTSNKEEAVEILTRHLNVDTKIASQTYDRYLQSQTFNLQGEVNLEGVSEAMKVMASTGQISATLTDPSKYYDLTYYREALQ
jgi:ABC-type nitrate/sulfonate/bicarbonate transport system substrate-binding protein